MQTVALRGYDRTTIDRVLDVAEVPAPVFDEHFEDKQDCLLAALDELIGRIECMISERIDESEPWSERVRLGLQTLLAALACNPDGARVVLVECLSAGEPAIARVRGAVASFVPVLEEGRRSGSCDAEATNTDHLPPQTSEAVVGGIAAILHRRVARRPDRGTPGTAAATCSTSRSCPTSATIARLRRSAQLRACDSVTSRA